MTACAAERYIKKVSGYNVESIQIGVDAGAAKIWEGAMVTALTATGMAVRAGTAAASPCRGVALNTVDASAGGSDGDYSVNLAQGMFWFANDTGDACTEAHIGTFGYIVDDQTVSSSHAGSTRLVAGVILGIDATDGVLVYINGVLNQYFAAADAAALAALLVSTGLGEGATLVGIDDVANNFAANDVEAALAEIISRLAAITATNGASMVGLRDAASYTLSATVETAIAELYLQNLSVQKQVNIPLTSCLDPDGDPLAKFANGASAVPGFNLADSKALNMRWNDNATHNPVLFNVAMPQDLDDAADVVLHILASKTGATAADLPTFTVTAFEQVVGAAHDADVDFGGVTAAMANPAAKTVQEITLTLALANVHASPQTITFTIQPTNGTMAAADDLCVHGMWLEYKGKLLAA